MARNLRRNGLEGCVRYTTLDWRDPDPAVEPAQVVIASDVLYATELPGLVAETFARFMVPGGVGMLADPGRAWLPEVEAAARGCGLHVEVDVVHDHFGAEAFLIRFC